MRLFFYNCISFLSIVIIFSCNDSVPNFDENSAYQFLLDQCDFGPRNPGSEGYNNCKEYLIKTLDSYSDTVFTQPFVINDIDDTQYDLDNIIAQYNINSNSHLLLGAHWDTRPWADSDLNIEKHNQPIIGANDGASGVSVLLELAKIFHYNPPPIRVSIVLFDAEDMGRPGVPKSYARGSQFFAKNLPIEKPDEAIILDMIGDKELHIPIERYSYQQNKDLVKKLWSLANKLNLEAFESRIVHTIYDDHVPLWQEAKIPAIDIIDFNYPNRYSNYWHTSQDTPDNCSAQSLGQVGNLLVHYIYGSQK
ncbi:MAG: M28 family peptidase [Candidatus Neomarinimicrobiota bacterium]|mgnify:FL=1|jgi:glutaminyl-peptide cyclotransferase|nr:M28 family peptidase [Candidatus Neomarinimicrobiota bacterium]MEC9026947.1 M28 family peptidase [Candidatus Neomarinimicrobiota bacterium]MEC9106303.1 M28 family peptidase [Candidatus Neomarinimicrobiota bacterium]|tara:strand:+ start:1188 stop:2108 length:921 start_codon:yes stop_codon:yes gene_type:complete